MPGQRRMNTIRSPIRGRTSCGHGLVKHTLKRDPDRTLLFGDSPCGGAPFIKLRKPLLVNRATAKHKGLTNHQRRLGERFSRGGQ